MSDQCRDCMGTGESFPGIKCRTCKGDGVARRKPRTYHHKRGGVLMVSDRGRCSVIAPWGGPAVEIPRKAAADALRSARRAGQLFRRSPSIVARESALR